MISYLRRHMNAMDIVETSQYVLIKGVDKWGVFKDINLFWETSIVSKYMFLASSSSDLKIPHFFLPDFIYMMRTLHDAKRTYIPKRTYTHVVELLKEKTWIGKAEDGPFVSIINESSIGSQAPFTLKPYQNDFIRHYGLVVPAYRLNGYMLDAGTGSGKTMTSIEWAEALGADKVIVTCPPNVVDSVWAEHLLNKVKVPKRVWLSSKDLPLTLDYDYYVVHFQQLGKFAEFITQHAKSFANSAMILDESHNLNKTASDRSSHVSEIGALPAVVNSLWMSATPITAIGVECIPFLRMADKFFTKDVEERFRRIYSKSARKANEILRNRMNILKYHIPKQDLPDITMTHHEVPVKMPDAKDFVLTAISKHLRDYMLERLAFYEKNRHEYTKTYDDCLEIYKKTLHPNELGGFDLYRNYIDVIRRGYDAKQHRELSMYCNTYERKNIIPRLPDKKKEPFRQSKSVVKYPQLKALGESLGMLGTYRSDCHVKMVDHIDMESLIDSAEKKTVIFTSYLEVVDAVSEKLKGQGYSPLVVNGSNSKNLTAILKQFSEDPDANPLVTTYQSLSTGVPLTQANRTLYLNLPFRDATKVQADGRTARLGQDQPCDYFAFLLDTGNEPNISTRNLDIMTWSADQVRSILGTSNLDIDMLSNESEVEIAIGIEDPVKEDDAENTNLYEGDVMVPPFLFHGSKFKQEELKPGFKHTGEEVNWDKYESNHWLYATSAKDEAILLGIASAAEKEMETNRFRYDLSKRSIRFNTDKPIPITSLNKLEVYVYTIRGNVSDKWIKNINPHNDIKTEWKTEATVSDNIVSVEKINVESYLRGWTVRNS